jgi:hypothetical protein
MRTLFVTAVMALIASHALAQTPDSIPPSDRSTAAVEANLATPTGHEVSVSRRVSLEPYYVRWDVDSSPVNYETATFTVNNVTARQQLGFYEPVNITNEFGVRPGLHF